MFALFEKKDKLKVQDEIQIDFENTTIDTKDLSSDLENLAKKYKLSVKELDINILSYKSFCLSKDKEAIEINNENKNDLLSLENLLNPDISFYQELRVEVFLKNTRAKFPLALSVGTNSDSTVVRATIKPKEDISFYEMLEDEIISELNKRKAKLGFMIGMMDECMISGVKKLISIIRVNKAISKNTSFNICEGIKPVEGIERRLIKHYENKQHDNNNSTMYGVKKGALVLEIIKPKDGSNGRNCKGEILEVNSVELDKKDIVVNVSDDEFIKKEDEDSVSYFAKLNGYIHEGTDGKFEIKDEYVVESVSLKTTGNIDVGDDSDVTVVIKEDTSTIDAVGPGVDIDTNEVHVAGNVANNASIKAKNVVIDGQLHKSAKVHSKKAKIHLHKGYVEGETIEINILEGGEVVGDIVRVKQLSGGIIKAKEVYISSVISNSKVYASHHIEIDKIDGNGNLFTIDSLVQRDFHDRVDKLNREIFDLKYKLKKIPKELRQLKAKIDSQKDNVNEIKKSIEEMKRFGKTPLASLVMKLKEHQEKIRNFNSLVKELKDAKLEKENLTQELIELNSSVLMAKVVCKSRWREFNEVKFKLIEPPVELSFLPKEDEIIKTLSVESSEEGEYILSPRG